MFGRIFLGEYQFCCEALGVFSVKKLYFPTVLDEETVFNSQVRMLGHPA